MNAIKRKRIEAGYRYLKLAGIVFVITLAGAILASCKTTVYNYGDNTTLEMSPARNIYPNTSVMNGLSLIPGNDKGIFLCFFKKSPKKYNLPLDKR